MKGKGYSHSIPEFSKTINALLSNGVCVNIQFNNRRKGKPGWSVKYINEMPESEYITIKIPDDVF